MNPITPQTVTEKQHTGNTSCGVTKSWERVIEEFVRLVWSLPSDIFSLLKMGSTWVLKGFKIVSISLICLLGKAVNTHLYLPYFLYLASI